MGKLLSFKPVLDDRPVKPPAPLQLYNSELECAVIGALLYYPDLYSQVSAQLKARHFHEPFLAEVYDWIGVQHEEGAVAGEALQWACLQSVEHIAQASSTIAHCIMLAIQLARIDVPYGVRKLVEFGERRRLMNAGADLIGMAERGDAETLNADAIALVAPPDDMV